MPRLPLTTFEQYLLHDDRRAYPCWMLGRLRWRGTFQHEPMERVWAETAQRHPLLASVVRKGFGGKLFWEPAPGGPAPIEWRSGPPATDTANRANWPVEEWAPIDLTKEPGLRWIFVEDGATTDLIIQTHHAVLDGGAIFAVIHELMLHYTRELGQAVELPELRPEMLRTRGRFGDSLWERLKLLPVHLAGLALAWPILRREVAPFVPHRAAADRDAPPPGLPAIVGRRFSPDDFKHIRAAAKRLGAGVNDLLTRDLFAAVGAWRAAQGVGTPLDWIRLGVPVSLRTHADRHLPAANVFSLVGLDRRAKSLANRDRLLRRAREDMELVKKHRLGHTFLLLLGLHRLRPGGIFRYTRRPACRATLVLTNMGQFFSPRSPLLDVAQRLAVPGAVLEDIQIGGLFRPATCATVAVGIYAGQLHADLHYDARFLTAAQAEIFMQTFEQQVRLSMETAAKPG